MPKRRARKTRKQRKAENPPLRIDLGCGKNKRDGFTGVDCRKFPGVDLVADLRKRWPWKDSTVDEAFSSHFVEHLTASERVHFANELFRVLKPGAKAQVVAPHWANARAYGDLTHQWPPVSEWWGLYLNKAWRDQNAPHNDGYTCDFDFGVGYGLRPDLMPRSPEVQQAAVEHEVNAATDLVFTLTKRDHNTNESLS